MEFGFWCPMTGFFIWCYCNLMILCRTVGDIWYADICCRFKILCCQAFQPVQYIVCWKIISCCATQHNCVHSGSARPFSVYQLLEGKTCAKEINCSFDNMVQERVNLVPFLIKHISVLILCVLCYCDSFIHAACPYQQCN